MGTYLVNFSLYTLAMVGVIFCGLFVFKSVMGGNTFTRKSAFVKILDVVKLSPRKSLYVIKAGNEKFLIAGDTERTTLISKLDGAKNTVEECISQENIVQEPVEEIFNSEISPKRATISEDIFKKDKSNYDFLSRPIKTSSKLRPEKKEGLNTIYGEECIDDEFAEVLNLRRKEKGKTPMMRGIVDKLNV